jgi:hypothetical protein
MCERRQYEKAKYWLVLTIWHSGHGKTMGKVKRSVASWGLEGWIGGGQWKHYFVWYWDGRYIPYISNSYV